MFDQLLQAYPEVHPEDFVTFGVLQEQPRRGSAREWGEVAGLLANMVGGRQTLVAEISAIVNRISRLDRADPIRVTEEMALVAVLRRERCRSRVPLEEGVFDQLAAPVRPMTRPALTDPATRALATRAVALLSPLHPTLSLSRQAPREDQAILPPLTLGPPGPRGDVSGRDWHQGPQEPRVAHVPLRALRRSISRPTTTQQMTIWTRLQRPPPPTVSDDQDDDDMETDEESDLLASPSHNNDSSDSDSDGFQHV